MEKLENDFAPAARDLIYSDHVLRLWSNGSLLTKRFSETELKTRRKDVLKQKSAISKLSVVMFFYY